MLSRGLHTGSQVSSSQGLRSLRVRPERQVSCNSRRYGPGYGGGMSYDSSEFLGEAIRKGLNELPKALAAFADRADGPAWQQKISEWEKSLEEMKKAQEDMEKARQEGAAPPNPDFSSSSWWERPGAVPDYAKASEDYAKAYQEWTAKRAPWGEGEVVVAVDVEEYPDAYALWMDVPGLQKKDVKIQVSPSMRTMTISGERKRTATESSGRVRHERKMGSFSRTIRLAKDLDASTISARVDRGVLHVTAKKHPVVEPEDDSLEISIE